MLEGALGVLEGLQGGLRCSLTGLDGDLLGVFQLLVLLLQLFHSLFVLCDCWR